MNKEYYVNLLKCTFEQMHKDGMPVYQIEELAADAFESWNDERLSKIFESEEITVVEFKVGE